MNILTDGYTVVKNIFSADEIATFRKGALDFFSAGGGFANSTGRAKPDWIKEKELLPLYEIYKSKNIEKIIEGLIGEKVEFAEHNDLHINRNVGWHKDRLNNDARKYELNSPWDIVDDETMKIYKVNFYLQSHETDFDGLIVKNGSHMVEDMQTGENVLIRPGIGDLVIFDQRITHMAQWSGGYDRLLICMGFGVKNIFLDQFKEGTRYRQDKQNARSKQ